MALEAVYPFTRHAALRRWNTWCFVSLSSRVQRRPTCSLDHMPLAMCRFGKSELEQRRSLARLHGGKLCAVLRLGKAARVSNTVDQCRKWQPGMFMERAYFKIQQRTSYDLQRQCDWGTTLDVKLTEQKTSFQCTYPGRVTNLTLEREHPFRKQW